MFYRTDTNLILKVFLALVLSFGFSTFSFAKPKKNPDVVLGKWKTYQRMTGEWVSTVMVKKNKKNNTYYAQIIKTNPKFAPHIKKCTNCPPKFANKPIIGFVMVWNMTPSKKNPHHFINGYGLDPWSGNYFKGEATMHRDTMRLRGTLLESSWIGQRFLWRRAK